MMKSRECVRALRDLNDGQQLLSIVGKPREDE